MRFRLTQIFRKISAIAPVASKNILCLAGIAAVDYGLWSIYKPVGWIFGGLALFYTGLVIDKESRHGSGT
jgi:hypothetical protein